MEKVNDSTMNSLNPDNNSEKDTIDDKQTKKLKREFTNIVVNNLNNDLGQKCYSFMKESKLKKEDFIIEFDLEDQDVIDYYINDDVLNRFMIARENNVKKAFDMWCTWFKWRLTFHPEKINVDTIKNQLEIGKAYMHGKDKEGRPCLVVKPGKHFPSECSYEDTMKLAVFWIEKITKESDNVGKKQIVAIIDRKDSGIRNVDYKMIGQSGIISMLQDFYAERLHGIYVLHVNWVFRMVYKLIKPFMSERTTSKLHILSGIEDLKTFFNEEDLMIEHGGKSEYVYSVPKN